MGMNIFKRMAVTFVSLLIVVLVLSAGTTVFAEETKTEEVKVVAEKENNNKKSKANKIELGGAITGKLSSEKDADWYKFSSLGEGKIQFNFTHEASGAYAYYWYATVYDTDGKKVLNEGTLSGREPTDFSVSVTKEGTYYLKISKISGGNPLTNGFTKDKYTVAVSFECNLHSELLPWETTIEPDCKNNGERVQKCSVCKNAVVSEVLPMLEHTYNEWSIVDEASTFNIGEKKHTCVLCGTVSTKMYLATTTKILLIVAGALILALIIFVIIKKVREEKSYSSSYRSSYSGSSYSGSSSSSSSSSGSSSSYSGSSSYDYSSSGSSYDDDLPTSVYNSQYTTVGGIDYAVHTTDAEGYSTSSYYEDAEGYKHSTDGLDVSEPFNWLDL